MSRRYLFGPVSPAFVDQNLYEARETGRCRCFGYGPGTEIRVRPGESWDALTKRLPTDWDADFLVLHLAYTSIPASLSAAPIPIIGLAADWNLQWHHQRRRLPRCDLVFTDTVGVEALQREGIAQARVANLYGCERDFLAPGPTNGPRDIDILFVGNLHPAVQRERLAWLGRLARLADRWNVQIVSGVHGENYRALLRRARIVFNQGIRGECNRRVFEATAAGALLFQEAGNREVPTIFTDRQECVFYTEDNLEALLEHYLTHEDERRALAHAGRQRVQEYSFPALWSQALAQVEAEWDTLVARARQRTQPEPAEELSACEKKGTGTGQAPETPMACMGRPEPVPVSSQELITRSWQAVSATERRDPALVPELAAAVAGNPGSPALLNALGVMEALEERHVGNVPHNAARAAERFQAALRLDEDHAVAALNLAEAFSQGGQNGAAINVCRILLGRLDRCPDQALCHALRFPAGFDLFRVEWEKAAWQHAGDSGAEAKAKRTLVRWRLHSLLALLTGELAEYEAAAQARPDLPMTRAALGCALGRAGRSADAVRHLRFAVAANPFDLPAARALCQALRDSGDVEGADQVVADCRRLARAAGGIVPIERWFAGPAPGGHELTSIVILCCNEADVTRLCLESVLRHTRPPYELILVDNGSTDGTPTLLEEFRGRSSVEGNAIPFTATPENGMQFRSTFRPALPVRVNVVRNQENQGFPKGCNQGLAAARGDFVVLLNNDTVVTPGWLEGLVERVVAGWPGVALVGPVSNYAPAPQFVPAGYDDLADLDAFAERRRQEFATRTLDHPRLTGFCLLARRDVLKQLGGLDEQFGLGFFEDDDLCVRVRRAGYRLVVALDTYIHHFGSRTFARQGVDCQTKLRENLAAFAAKWGPEEASPYRMPSLVADPSILVNASPTMPAADSHGARPKVSLTMIVRNEEANLPDCLGSVADLVDEIILVDTGSTDRTKQIAVGFGAKVFDFPWCDSFAAARNEALRHATGEWAFWLDADDRLDEENRHKLRALFAGLPDDNVAYSLKCLCLPEGPGRTGTVVDHVRLFRNRPDVRWSYRVHEQILPALRATNVDVRWADVVIHHTGYRDPALRGRKLDRDLRLLRLELAEQPDHPFTLFNLGSVYQELGQHAEALIMLRRSLERSHPRDSIVRKLYALIATCHQQLGQFREGIAACQEGRQHYPDDTELLFRESLLRRQLGDRTGAIACLQEMRQTRPAEHFGSVDADLRGYKARQNLAVIYIEEGRLGEAEAEYRAVVAERPDFLPAWLGLAEVYVKAARWAELDDALKCLESLPGGAVEAAILQARGLLARKDFAAARALLERIRGAQPEHVMARVFLSHVLLQEGNDLDAAEKVLRDILALAPDHAESRHNLSVLLANRQRQRSDAIFAGNVGLAQLYREACARPSDIHEHLPTLHALAKECRHVTEMGTRTGISTTAFLYAQPQKLVCYDRERFPQVDPLQALAGFTEFVFHQQDVLWVDIEETDLLFIDTWHVESQLKQELDRHAGQARTYIVLHDTTTFGEQGEAEGHRGLWPAVEEFLAQGTFRLRQRYHNNNGLTVLERVRPHPAAG